MSIFFFFKQKTAYEMRISDWSSDVCSSDLLAERKSKSPLFLQIGFPGPHPLYDPLPGFLDAYQGVDIPVPHPTEAELAAQPPSHAVLRNNMIRNQDRKSVESGKSVAARVDLGGCSLIKKKK